MLDINEAMARSVPRTCLRQRPPALPGHIWTSSVWQDHVAPPVERT